MKPCNRSIIVVACATLALPAAADVIYSNFQNITIPTTYDGVYLNVETGAWNTNMLSPVSGWDINPYFGGSTVANSPAFQPVRSGTGSLDPIVNLTAGTTIGSGSTFSTAVQSGLGENPGGPAYGGSQTHMGNGAGQFTSGTEGYLGFRLDGTNYGSMRVVFTNNTGGAVIKDWAYDTSGASVVAGAIKQVGQDVIISSGFTLASALIDSGGATNLVKNGSGTNILSAASTITGTTTVNEGILAVNGSLADTSAVTVANTGTLSGNGSIGGSVTIQNGGTLAAGTTGLESLATGSLTLNAGSTFAYEMDNDASLGLAGDLTVINGGLNFDLTNAAILTLNDLGSGSWTIGEKLTLLSYTGSWNTGLFTYLGGTLADDSTITYSGMTWMFDYNDSVAGGNLTGDLLPGSSYVTLTAVPEPRAALLGALGLFALMRRRRS